MIRLENLNINLKNNKLLIGNINIFIHSGCIVSITGKPASGKTKLFNIIGLRKKQIQAISTFWEKTLIN